MVIFEFFENLAVLPKISGILSNITVLTKIYGSYQNFTVLTNMVRFLSNYLIFHKKFPVFTESFGFYWKFRF